MVMNARGATEERHLSLHASRGEDKWKRIAWLVIATGGLFRLVLIGARQLTTEELMQAVVVRAHSVGEWLECLDGGMFLATPLDHLIQKCITAILGESAWALRLHAAFLGTLAIWVFYRLARFLFRERVAVFSTILFAFFPLTYHYSQEGQSYSLLLLATLLSYSRLVKIVADGEHSAWSWGKLTSVLIFLLYSNYLGVTVVLSQLAGLLLLTLCKPDRHVPPPPSIMEKRSSLALSAGRRQVFLYAGAAVVALLAFVPWAYFLWHRPAVVGAREVLSLKLPGRILKEFGDGSYPVSILLIAGLTAGIRMLKRHRQHNLLLWLLAWGCFSFLPVIVFELSAGLPFAIHDVLHCLPPLILITGYGLSHLGEQMTLLDRLPHKVSSPSKGYAVLLVLLSGGIAWNHWRSEPVDWKGTAAYLEGTARAGDSITMVKLHGLLEYYSPSLANFRSYNLDPGPGPLDSGAVTRRIVVCLNSMPRDPSLAFQSSARRSAAWKKLQRRGFTIFIREK